MGLYSDLIEDKYHIPLRNREKTADKVCLCLIEGQETFQIEGQEVSPKPIQKEDREKEGEK